MLPPTYRAKPEQYEKTKPASERASIEQTFPCTDSATKPALWIELLPLAVQYRIAEYVCEGLPGRSALNLASCTPQTAELVSVALNHHLLDFPNCRVEQHTRAWIQHYRNVRVLELWEHPNNFELLKSPSLQQVDLDDDPLQVSALADSRVNVERIEFYARYGTPSNVIVDMFSKISFTALEFADSTGSFFQDVDVETFAEACKSVTYLFIVAPSAAQQPIKRLIQKLPNLEWLCLEIDDVIIDFKGQLPDHHQNPIVVDLGLYIRPIPWFETFVLPEQLRSLWLSSGRGWGENEILQFGAVVMHLPNLCGLTVKFRGSSERFFPSVSSLTRFHAYWDDCVQLPDGEEVDYTPEKGIVAKMIRGLPNLESLGLCGVALDDEEVTQIIASVGNRIENIGLPIWRQHTNPMERLLVVIKALIKYAKRLEVFRCCHSNEYGQEPPFTSKPIKTKRKREIFKYLDRLIRLVPDLPGSLVYTIADYPEEEDEDKKVEEELQEYFSLRRVRKFIEFNDLNHLFEYAKLLETGCEDLPQDRKAALQFYRSAVERGDSEDAILHFWRLTEDPKDSSFEPKPGGAFELILELDRNNVQKLTDIADIFLIGTDNTEWIPSAAAKLLQLAINRGFTDTYCKKLAKLVERGYDDVPPDPERAFALYQLAIDDQNDPTAMFNIADMLKSGFGDRKPDPATARKYLERGAQLEWAPCINDLALLISQGYDDVPPDYAAAIKLYKRAIAHGNTVSMSNLARLYVQLAEGDKIIVQKAIRLYERAISEGQSIFAMVLLAALYQNGCGQVSANPARAKELYIQAIEYGDTSAFVCLGNLVCRGYDNKPPDPDEAMRLYQLAIDTGDQVARGLAFTAYGDLMERGCAHVEADVTKAVAYYRRGVEIENLGAINHLAALLDEGRSNLQRDVAEAYRLFERGIDLGSTDSMLGLSNLLQRDSGGTKQNLIRAKDLCTDALNAGCISAYSMLGHMVEFGLGFDGPDPERAVQLYKKGIELGDLDSIVCLGSLYERGFGQQCPDPLVALRYYNWGLLSHDFWLARCYLGFLFEDGYLQQPPRYQAAMERYEDSAAGDTWVDVFRGMLIERGYDDNEPDPKLARSIYEEAVRVSTDTRSTELNAFAMGRLGRLIEKNSGGDTVKLREAADWYKKAIERRKEATALTYLAGLLLKGYNGVDADVPQAVSMLEEAVEDGTFAPPCFLLASCIEKGYGDVEPDPERAVILEEQGCFIMMNPSPRIWKPWQRLRSPALYQA